MTQIERPTTALDDLDAAMVAERPPPTAGAGPSDVERLQPLPGIGPQAAATLLGELGTMSRFASATAPVASVGFPLQLAERGERNEAPRLAHLGSRVARHALDLAAVTAVRRSAAWRTLGPRKKAQGTPAKPALIVVAVKRLHTIDAMGRDRRPDHPSRLLVAPATIGA